MHSSAYFHFFSEIEGLNRNFIQGVMKSTELVGYVVRMEVK